MTTIVRTDSANEDFRKLVVELDKDLAIRDGDDHAFFAQYNKIANIAHVVVAYDGNEAVGCGEESMIITVPYGRAGAGRAGALDQRTGLHHLHIRDWPEAT